MTGISVEKKDAFDRIIHEYKCTMCNKRFEVCPLCEKPLKRKEENSCTVCEECGNRLTPFDYDYFYFGDEDD